MSESNNTEPAAGAPSMRDPAAKDPWQHRSEGMQCSTCMWYVEKKGPNTGKIRGRCRRHAPSMSGYPVVFVDDWCGDHKLA